MIDEPALLSVIGSGINGRLEESQTEEYLDKVLLPRARAPLLSVSGRLFLQRFQHLLDTGQREGLKKAALEVVYVVVDDLDRLSQGGSGELRKLKL